MSNFYAFLHKHWQKLLALTIWLALIGGYWLYARHSGASLWQSIVALVQLLRSPLMGVLLFILLYTVRPLAFFSAVVLSLLGGSLYGPWVGFLANVIGSNAGALLAYTLGRFFGQNWVSAEPKQSSWVGRYTERMRRNSFETVFIMRLLYLPYDLVNYLSGFLRIDWRAFLAATALGSIPGTIAFTLLGAGIPFADLIIAVENQHIPRLPNALLYTFISFAILAVSSLVSRYMRRKEGDPSSAD